MAQEQARKRTDYGIDAPGVVRNNLLIGVGLTGVGYWLLLQPAAALGGWGGTLGAVLLLVGISFIVTGGIMLVGSRSGKLRVRERLLAQVPWRGDERVLDVGCGRGLLLVGAAKRAPRGRVFGLDVWHSVDQANNSAGATLANAQAEGVSARVALATADMRAIPYPEACFDAITSSWAIHNIPTREGRAQAVHEILRVLRPGGWIAIADIERIDEYVDLLQAAGMSQLVRSRPYYIFAIPTYLLVARKAER
jgi:arsenite methyltransferase